MIGRAGLHHWRTGSIPQQRQRSTTHLEVLSLGLVGIVGSDLGVIHDEGIPDRLLWSPLEQIEAAIT